MAATPQIPSKLKLLSMKFYPMIKGLYDLYKVEILYLVFSSKLKLLSMKLFHDDQLNFTEMDPMKAFLPDD